MANPARRRGNLAEVFLAALKLGATSFGGPVAHLGYFREEYVSQKKWLDDKEFADLVALCQFLPGPASSQVGIGVGWLRARFPGAVAAWLGFTLPSALLLISFAWAVQAADLLDAGWIQGLKIAAVAIVAQAVYGMGKSIVTDGKSALIALVSACVVLFWRDAQAQLLVIAAAGLFGWLALRKTRAQNEVAAIGGKKERTKGIAALTVFFALLVALPLLVRIDDCQIVHMFDSLYRTGALVFGGGHVVLPLLQSGTVSSGWLSEQQFLAGYGAAQAVPGPLFAFAAYIGMMMNGWAGAALATIAIFLPGFLLVIGVLPFWNVLRRKAGAQAALRGINASVVGILLAALYDPVWSTSIHTNGDFALALAAFFVLVLFKRPPWVAVLLCAVGGWLLHV
ncbi:MAG TPA: chromate efflux transporter [Bacilli bacterium]